MLAEASEDLEEKEQQGIISGINTLVSRRFSFLSPFRVTMNSSPASSLNAAHLPRASFLPHVSPSP